MKSTRHVVAGIMVTLVLASSACGRESSASGTVLRRDSAGIELVEVSAPIWPRDASWSVAANPDLTIGLEEGDAPYLFGAIAGAVLLGDGSIVVADAQAAELRYFDASGRFDRRAGRRGEGPGEFSSLHTLWLCGEEKIYAWDRMRRRILVWDRLGQLQREFDFIEPGSAGRGPYAATCASDGSVLAVGWGNTAALSNLGRSQYVPHVAPVWVLDSLGTSPRTIGSFQIAERVFLYNPNTGGGSAGPYPFGRAAQFAIDSQHVYVAGSERLDVQVHSKDGKLLRVFRGPDHDHALGDTILDSYLAGGVPRRDSVFVARIRRAELPLPSSLPAVVALTVDPMRNIWVKRFQLPAEPQERWGVFSADGAFLGHVSMPPSFRLLQVGRRVILGVERDHMDVQRVQVRALLRESNR